MKELTTELPDDANVSWRSNGHCRWLVDEDGQEYCPPKWVYRLVEEAAKGGRNQVRHDFLSMLEKE